MFIALMAGALAAAIADGVPWQIRGRVLDDNLTIPFTCAFIILMFS
jgi:dolichol kinase